MLRYTLSDFNNISINNKPFVLSPNIITIINNINNKVSAPNYKKTPNFKHNKHYKNNKKHISWNIIRNFKPTNLVIKDDDTLNNHDIINNELNKITIINFDINIEVIKKYIDTSNDKDIFIYFIKVLFYKAEKNKSLIKLYTNILEYFNKNYDINVIINNIINEYIDNYLTSIDLILDVNNDKHYTEFCIENKKRDKRLNIISFIIELCNVGIINNDTIIPIIYMIIDTFNINIKEDDKVNKTEELIEHLIILIFHNKTLNNHDEYTLLYNKVIKITKLNTNEYSSLTFKSIFKLSNEIK